MTARAGGYAKGKLITLEGPEGSGKSTHCKLLFSYLRKKGYKVVLAREPGGTVIGEQIRRILLNPKNKKLDVACEVLLYMAARRQLVLEKILPALKSGKIVLLDRFLDATICYQGYAGGYSVAAIKKMGESLLEGVKPALTIVLDLKPKIGLAKCLKKDRIERKTLAFHQRVRCGYLRLAKQNPRRVKIIPVEEEVSSTQAEIRRVLIDSLK